MVKVLGGLEEGDFSDFNPLGDEENKYAEQEQNETSVERATVEPIKKEMNTEGIITGGAFRVDREKESKKISELPKNNDAFFENEREKDITGPHLHLKIRENKTPVDPKKYVKGF